MYHIFYYPFTSWTTFRLCLFPSVAMSTAEQAFVEENVKPLGIMLRSVRAGLYFYLSENSSHWFLCVQLWPGIRNVYLLSPLLFNKVLGTLARATSWEKEMKRNVNRKGSQMTPMCRWCAEKPVAFLCTNRRRAEKEIMAILPLIIASKNIQE